MVVALTQGRLLSTMGVLLLLRVWLGCVCPCLFLEQMVGSSVVQENTAHIHQLQLSPRAIRLPTRPRRFVYRIHGHTPPHNNRSE